MNVIPFNPSKSADQAFQVLLPEVAVLTIRLLWNVRESCWHMDVKNNTSELYGIKLVPGVPLLHGLGATSPVTGDFIVFPVDSRNTQSITYDGLGSDWVLYYITPDEVETWEVTHGVG